MVTVKGGTLKGGTTRKKKSRAEEMAGRKRLSKPSDAKLSALMNSSGPSVKALRSSTAKAKFVKKSIASETKARSKTSSKPSPSKPKAKPARGDAPQTKAQQTRTNKKVQGRAASDKASSKRPNVGLPSKPKVGTSSKGIHSKAGSDITGFLKGVLDNEVNAIKKGPIGKAYRAVTKRTNADRKKYADGVRSRSR